MDYVPWHVDRDTHAVLAAKAELAELDLLWQVCLAMMRANGHTSRDVDEVYQEYIRQVQPLELVAYGPHY